MTKADDRKHALDAIEDNLEMIRRFVYDAQRGRVSQRDVDDARLHVSQLDDALEQL